VCDFVTERNMVQNSSKHFGPTWKQQWPIVDCLVDWFCNKHLVCGFLFHGQAIQLRKKCSLTGVFTQATCDDWTSTFEIIKVQCSHVAFIKELEWRFPNQELMNTIGIIYP
jgi:hypothetical protein